MQLNCWASAPPAALPWESIELRLTTLRPFGGARIQGSPPASQRTSTTRPSLRTAYPKITPVSATSTATLDCTTRPPIDSCCSTPFTHFVALHPTRKASPAAPTITEPSSVIGCVRRAVRPSSSDARLRRDRKSTRLNSSHSQISYAVFCLKQKTHHFA